MRRCAGSFILSNFIFNVYKMSCAVEFKASVAFADGIKIILRFDSSTPLMGLEVLCS